jgi:TLC ATP/ADP transporter
MHARCSNAVLKHGRGNQGAHVSGCECNAAIVHKGLMWCRSTAALCHTQSPHVRYHHHRCGTRIQKRVRHTCCAQASNSSNRGSKGPDVGQSIWQALQDVVGSLHGMWRKFVPMATLFFLMAFVNTILDNLKDTLIFTLAVGGGAHVVPWLTGELQPLRPLHVCMRYL